MLGLINLDKPPGFTSHDCVAKVRRLLRTKRVGHGGTLDPLATGVLPIAVGRATRLLQFLPERKVYRARVRFGVRTSTDDLEGEVLADRPASGVTEARVRPLLAQFCGRIVQVPPAYSAIQLDGKRLYERARAGETVEVPSREVEVFELAAIAWTPGLYPELEVEIACGPGTYIRAIARDLGDALGTGATLARLIRTESCGLKLADSVTLEALAQQVEAGTFALLPADVALAHLPVVTLPTGTAKRWCQGQVVPRAAAIAPAPAGLGQPARVYDKAGTFLGVAIAQETAREMAFAPKVVLV